MHLHTLSKTYDLLSAHPWSQLAIAPTTVAHRIELKNVNFPQAKEYLVSVIARSPHAPLLKLVEHGNVFYLELTQSTTMNWFSLWADLGLCYSYKLQEIKYISQKITRLIKSLDWNALQVQQQNPHLISVTCSQMTSLELMLVFQEIIHQLSYKDNVKIIHQDNKIYLLYSGKAPAQWDAIWQNINECYRQLSPDPAAWLLPDPIQGQPSENVVSLAQQLEKEITPSQDNIDAVTNLLVLDETPQVNTEIESLAKELEKETMPVLPKKHVNFKKASLDVLLAEIATPEIIAFAKSSPKAEKKIRAIESRARKNAMHLRYQGCSLNEDQEKVWKKLYPKTQQDFLKGIPQRLHQDVISLYYQANKRMRSQIDIGPFERAEKRAISNAYTLISFGITYNPNKHTSQWVWQQLPEIGQKELCQDEKNADKIKEHYCNIYIKTLKDNQLSLEPARHERKQANLSQVLYKNFFSRIKLDQLKIYRHFIINGAAIISFKEINFDSALTPKKLAQAFFSFVHREYKKRNINEENLNEVELLIQGDYIVIKDYGAFCELFADEIKESSYSNDSDELSLCPGSISQWLLDFEKNNPEKQGMISLDVLLSGSATPAILSFSKSSLQAEEKIREVASLARKNARKKVGFSYNPNQEAIWKGLRSETKKTILEGIPAELHEDVKALYYHIYANIMQSRSSLATSEQAGNSRKRKVSVKPGPVTSPSSHSNRFFASTSGETVKKARTTEKVVRTYSNKGKSNKQRRLPIAVLLSVATVELISFAESSPQAEEKMRDLVKKATASALVRIKRGGPFDEDQDTVWGNLYSKTQLSFLADVPSELHEDVKALYYRVYQDKINQSFPTQSIGFFATAANDSAKPQPSDPPISCIPRNG